MQFGMMNGTGNYTGMMRGGYWFWDILGWIFGILVFIALILLIKYLWDRTFGGAKRREEFQTSFTPGRLAVNSRSSGLPETYIFG